MYGAAYRFAGYGGVAAVVTAALMGLHAVIFVNARRWVSPLLPIVLMDFVLIPMALARPHVLTWPLLALWTWLMLRARERNRAPPLPAALIMTFWANLHGSFVFGLAIAGTFGIEALLASTDRRRAFSQWLIFGIACVIAVLINGNGLTGVTHPFLIAKLTNLSLIDEWKPSNPKVTPVFFAILAFLISLIVWKRPRLHPIRWLLLGALLAFALLQVRQQAMLAIVAAVLLPPGFGTARDAQQAGAAALITAALAAMLVMLRAALPLSPPENESNPWKLIAAVPAELRSKPVLNGFSMGGPLILAGIRPYIDGRGDVYGDAFMYDYASISRGDPARLATALREWNIAWAILPHRNSQLIALLDRSGWRRVAKDRVGVIYVR
jgi:hypothetical protein